MGLIITIGGTPGSGKSTLGRMLATRLRIPFFSMGDIRREFAKERGMTLSELNTLAETDPESDNLVDQYQAEISKKHDSFIIDSRLGWHFIPESVKVYLKIDFHTAAERIFHQKRFEERWPSIEEGVAEMREREESDRKRYLQLYNIDHTDIRNYDLVIQADGMNPLEKMEMILSFLERRNRS